LFIFPHSLTPLPPSSSVIGVAKVITYSFLTKLFSNYFLKKTKNLQKQKFKKTTKPNTAKNFSVFTAFEKKFVKR